MPLVSFLSYRPARFPQSAIANNDRQVFIQGALLRVVPRKSMPLMTRLPSALIVRDRAAAQPIPTMRAQTPARISSFIHPAASSYAHARSGTAVLHSTGRSALRRRLLPRQAALKAISSLIAQTAFLNVRLPVAASVKTQAYTWNELFVRDRRKICRPGIFSSDTIATPVTTINVIDKTVLNRTYSKLVVY